MSSKRLRFKGEQVFAAAPSDGISISRRCRPPKFVHNNQAPISKYGKKNIYMYKFSVEGWRPNRTRNLRASFEMTPWRDILQEEGSLFHLRHELLKQKADS